MMASPLIKLLRTLQAPLVNVGLLMSQLKDKKSKVNDLTKERRDDMSN